MAYCRYTTVVYERERSDRAKFLKRRPGERNKPRAPHQEDFTQPLRIPYHNLRNLSTPPRPIRNHPPPAAQLSPSVPPAYAQLALGHHTPQSPALLYYFAHARKILNCEIPRSSPPITLKLQFAERIRKIFKMPPPRLPTRHIGADPHITPTKAQTLSHTLLLRPKCNSKVQSAAQGKAQPKKCRGGSAAGGVVLASWCSIPKRGSFNIRYIDNVYRKRGAAARRE